MASATALLAMAYANRALYAQQEVDKGSNMNESMNSSANKEKEQKNMKKKLLFGGWKVGSDEDDNVTVKKHDVSDKKTCEP